MRYYCYIYIYICIAQYDVYIYCIYINMEYILRLEYSGMNYYVI